MRDIELVAIDFDGLRVSGPAERVSDGVYRLAFSPWTVDVPDGELSLGDVVETTPGRDGYRSFTRVVERSGDTHQGWVVGPAFLRSSFFDTFAAGLEAAGGTWEVPLNGWLLTHVPAGSPFDVANELERLLDQARVAGVVDPEASQGDGHAHEPSGGAND